jgi:hypothetical protein
MGGRWSGRHGISPASVRRIALGLPEATEKPCYGTPAFYVKKTLFARLREDNETLVVKMSFEQRDAMLEGMPDVFYITPHYQAYPLVLVRLPVVAEGLLRDVLVGAWRHAAPARLAEAYDAGRH